jgi:hypothetical protein
MAVVVASATGGAWSSTATWTGGVLPTTGDDVQLNATSGPVTIDLASVCRSIDCTGYTGTLTLLASTSLSIGDATAGTSNIALKFVPGMTLTVNSATTAPINFVSTSGTVQTIDFSGKTTGGVTFNGAGGSWQLVSGFTTPTTSTVALNNGTLNVNSQSCSWGLFASNNANTRTLTLGTSAITMTGTGNVWNAGGTVTAFTITANTATITTTGANATVALSTKNWNGMSVIMNGTGTGILAAGVGATLANFTRNGTATKTDNIQFGNSITFTGTLTLNGNSSINRLLVQSDTFNTNRTLTAATVSVTNADFQDITGAGAGSWNLAAITGLSGDCGGNSGITFTTSSTQTWSGTSGGSWSTNAWTTRVPLPQDDVIISSAFIASQTISAFMPRVGRSIDWTGSTGAPIWDFSSLQNTIYGSVTLAAGMTLSGTQKILFSGRGAYTITSNGVTFANTGGIGLYAPTGTYTLQSNLVTSGTFDLNTGTLNMNNFNVTSTIMTTNTTGTRGITFGTGTWNLTSTAAGNVWQINATGAGMTLSAASGTIKIVNATVNARTIAAGTRTYGTLDYTVAGSTGSLTLQTAATYDTIKFSDANNGRTLILPAATATTVNNWNVFGTAGKLMTINSSTAATAATISKASGTVSSDYLSLQDSTATGGATWYAGANSTNGTNNTGWIFTAPPVAAAQNKFFVMFR